MKGKYFGPLVLVLNLCLQIILQLYRYVSSSCYEYVVRDIRVNRLTMPGELLLSYSLRELIHYTLLQGHAVLRDAIP